MLSVPPPTTSGWSGESLGDCFFVACLRRLLPHKFLFNLVHGNFLVAEPKSVVGKFDSIDFRVLSNDRSFHLRPLAFNGDMIWSGINNREFMLRDLPVDNSRSCVAAVSDFHFSKHTAKRRKFVGVIMPGRLQEGYARCSIGNIGSRETFGRRLLDWRFPALHAGSGIA